MLRVIVVALAIPLGLDLYLPVPEDNPMTAEKIELGRRLFTDRRLSRDQSVACASCHRPDHAFSSPAAVNRGVFGRQGTRNAPALINRGWGRSFSWDGRVKTLEDQVLRPIEDSNEMDLSLEEAAARVGLSPTDMSHALATYLRSVMSGDAPYDRFVNGDGSALSDAARLGMRVFRGKGNCTACHAGPNLTDERTHNTGIAWRSGTLADEGRAAVTGRSEDRGAFKTPTLREVGISSPYMHDGSLASLEDVVDYYDRGGNRHPLLDYEIRPLALSEDEKRGLLAFLRSLSGRVTN